MIQPTFIEKKHKEAKQFNYDALRAEGIKLIQQLAGEYWTDFNTHDPGVTILEQVCFAITELAYRTDFKIEDLLFREGQKEQSFFRPDQVLPCNSLTIDDYRKLLFDSVFEIKNVWLQPVDNHKNSLNGLYSILLDIDEGITTKSAKEAVLKKARKVFLNSRNLCEDIEEIMILEHMPVALHADVELDGTISAEQVMGELLYRVDEYLSPQMKFYSLQELIDEGYTLNDIFEGPLLKHGFIKTSELPSKTDKILISELMKVIMQVEGVSSVKSLHVEADGQNHFNQVDIPFGKLPRLKTNLEAYEDELPVVLSKGRVNYSHIDTNKVARHLNELRSANKRVYRLSEEPIKLPEGKKMDTLSYHSIQNHFPQVYGLGIDGVSTSATPERKSQVLQLKGYLMLFEQILVNYLAQLSGVGELLSFKNTDKRTYFFKTLDEVPYSEKLYKTVNDGIDPISFRQHAIPPSYYEGLEKLTEVMDNYVDRRGRFLDYLLALHGESFPQVGTQSFKYYFPEATDDFLLKNKTRLLEFIPFINKNRNRGVDYEKEFSDEGNVAGLEVKLSVLLGLNFYSINDSKITDNISLIDHFKDQKLSIIQSSKSTASSERIIDSKYFEENFDYIDIEEFHDEQVTPANLNIKEIFHDGKITEDFLRNGLDIEKYQIGPDKNAKGKFIAAFKDTDSDAISLGSYESEEAAAKSVIALIDMLKELNLKCEGLHLIEHILLRPDVNDKKFGIYLLDENGNRLLRSRECFTFAERLAMVKKLKPFIPGEEYYSVETTRTKDFEIQFNVPDRKISFVSVEPNISVEKTHEIKERLYRFMSDTDDIVPFENKIDYFIQNEENGALIPEDFFEYRLSMIFPAWTARLNDPEFRSVVEEMVRNNQPANIDTRLFWFSIGQMKKFEKLYKQWIDALRNNDKEIRDNVSKELIMILLEGYKA
ncbi:hypothetical protein [Marinigracilibium pacificum]|uniref:Uncharacterized protein n=1 Tax=Marinigracilibium pacificum TaxID=2729599 RepID=A0A848IXV7_9BACT|nr:hypothetical protein [Marinigracilibium pacificum]NMM48466.1 hypothetical protein [Marinigracilibium pacificum]